MQKQLLKCEANRKMSTPSQTPTPISIFYSNFAMNEICSTYLCYNPSCFYNGITCSSRTDEKTANFKEISNIAIDSVIDDCLNSFTLSDEDILETCDYEELLATLNDCENNNPATTTERTPEIVSIENNTI
ncbi:hypothetical protein WA026_023636 [Henosepilachna vigintioctopunctata]|uniref:Uncharacterized protein n=1 Tax=Henosepilachna vigintioctopunctata TaxID=420089 RepID=A0AAW1UHB4_9CUCU